jgi:anti-sigma factor RsiW
MMDEIDPKLRDMLTCQELVETVTAYLDHAMSDAERRRFDEHLAVCPPCVEYVRQIKTTIQLTGQADCGVPGDADHQAVLHLFQDWKAGRGTSHTA